MCIKVKSLRIHILPGHVVVFVVFRDSAQELERLAPSNMSGAVVSFVEQLLVSAYQMLSNCRLITWPRSLLVEKLICYQLPSPSGWQIDGEAMERVTDFVFWAPKSLQMVTAAMKLKDTCSLEEKDRPRQHIKKQRHYFANKGPSSQSYGFSSSHIWM